MVRPWDQNFIACKWIYKMKEEKSRDGKVTPPYRSKMVAHGSSQAGGTDYSETFTPVLEFMSFRMLLSVAAVKNLNFHQMDAITPFSIEIQIEKSPWEQLERYEQCDLVQWDCRLNKALLGRNHASQQLYTKSKYI